MNKKSIVGIILLIVGIIIMYLSLSGDKCGGLSDPMCDRAKAREKVHGIAVYDAYRDYELNGAKPIEHPSKIDYVKKAYSLYKEVKGVL